MFTTPYLPSLLKLRFAGGGRGSGDVLQWKSSESFQDHHTFLLLLYHYLPLSCVAREDIWAWRMRAKRKERDDRAINAHKLPSFHFFPPFTSNLFFFYVLFLIHWFFQCIMAYRMAADFWGMSKGLFGQPTCPLFAIF